ncbi:MAG: Na/Pi cotransporter family protein [Eubacterium sp.]|nr:Na/Pi cotransporter family protein [Eubacterium sp.]
MFIFGMNLMSDGLKLVAGSYLKKILEKLTQNRILGMLVGAGLTALIQSSNAMCVMVVGFVNAGVMQLERSVGILMGAKIGTTITGQLIAFDIGRVAPLIAFVGVAVTMFVKKQKAKNIGQIITSLGVLFIGLDTMKVAMSPLKDEPWFQDLLTQFSNPILCVLIGIIFTVIIQSASASVGVLQTLAVAGVMTNFSQMFYLMLGMNIGASVAPLLASIGGRKDAKRVAIIVALFESIGMVLFVVATQLFPGIFDLIQGTSTDPSRQIANANSLFNIITVLVLLPCATYLVKISKKIVPGEDVKEATSLFYIDESGYQSGTVLIGQIDKEVERMFKMVKTNIEASTKVYYGKMSITREEFDENEATIDFLNKAIVDSLIRANEMVLTEQEALHAGNLYHIVTDLERIGDHAENVLGYAAHLKEEKKQFTDKALKDLKQLSEAIYEIYDNALLYFKEQGEDLYHEIYDQENKIDKLVEKMRSRNVKRLSKSKCGASQGLYYNEILVDLERVGDHALNIANACGKYYIDDDDDDQEGN